MKVLITGFDPFGGENINPALEAVKLLPDNISDAEVIKIEIPTVFRKSLEKINEEIEKHSEEYKDLWAKPEIKQEHQTDFYIQDDDLVIFFQPYDLSYYARGFVEFRLDLEDLSGYMKEEYRRLID